MRGMYMSDRDALEGRLGTLFEERLSISVASVDMDLFESGGLDSLAFVELLMQLELDLGVEVTLYEMELYNFRSIKRIAGFVRRKQSSDGTTDGDRTGQNRTSAM
jgi:acyl carrier protein